jgi:hypothetical protein
LGHHTLKTLFWIVLLPVEIDLLLKRGGSTQWLGWIAFRFGDGVIGFSSIMAADSVPLRCVLGSYVALRLIQHVLERWRLLPLHAIIWWWWRLRFLCHKVHIQTFEINFNVARRSCLFQLLFPRLMGIPSLRYRVHIALCHIKTSTAKLDAVLMFLIWIDPWYILGHAEHLLDRDTASWRHFII